MRQRMQETLSKQRIQESLYQTADAGLSLSASGCWRHSMRQLMRVFLYLTADA